MIPQYSDRLLTFSSTFQLDQFFSTGSIPTKLGIKHLLAKGIQVCTYEGDVLFHGEMISK